MTEYYDAKHIKIYKIVGISDLPEGKDIVISENGSFIGNVILTQKLEDHLLHISRKEGIIHYQCNVLANKIKAPDPEALLREIELALEEKKKKFKKPGVYLVLEGSLRITGPKIKKIEVVDEFSSCINPFPPGIIRNTFSPKFGSILLKVILSLSENKSLNYTKVGVSSFVFETDSKNPVYCIDFFTNLSATVSGPIRDEENKNFRLSFSKLENDEFESVVTLFLQSLKTEKDQKESYFNSWVALEKFIKKVFKKEFKVSWKDNVENFPVFFDEYFTKNKVLEKKSLNLVDKFGIICSFYVATKILDESAFKNDFEEFKKFYSKRNDVFHSKGFVDKEILPSEGVQKILKKHLNLYLNFKPHPKKET